MGFIISDVNTSKQQQITTQLYMVRFKREGVTGLNCHVCLILHVGTHDMRNRLTLFQNIKFCIPVQVMDGVMLKGIGPCACFYQKCYDAPWGLCRHDL